jgi:hypothetical protein
MNSEIIQTIAYDNYDDFQHDNFIFSQIFISLFWRLFNDETDFRVRYITWTWKGLKILRRFISMLVGRGVVCLKQKVQLQLDDHVRIVLMTTIRPLIYFTLINFIYRHHWNFGLVSCIIQLVMNNIEMNWFSFPKGGKCKIIHFNWYLVNRCWKFCHCTNIKLEMDIYLYIKKYIY